MFTYGQWVGTRDKFDHRVTFPLQDETRNSHVSWMLESQVQDGRENDVRALMTEMVSAMDANEPGAPNYEWSTSSDGKQCHLYERYEDSAATMTHLGTFGERFAGLFGDTETKTVRGVRLIKHRGARRPGRLQPSLYGASRWL